jgi:DMSO/TMAO reductase YedYZ molybdopterin-dependent catalytic subunit
MVLATAAALAMTTWGTLTAGATATERRTSRRRFTGSREADYGTPNGFFVTAFLNDNPAPLDRSTWRLRIVGLIAQPLILTHADLRAETALAATVDCTGGVYATREWSGLSLGPLLDAVGVASEARMVWFISTTGHRWPLPLDEARRALLATHVGGEPLAHEHGFPLRLVAPERRGFQWVKWLDTIEIA